MIRVVGGIYFERCWEGDWDQLFGSGLRAAAALASLGAEVRLEGFASKESEPAVRASASALGVAVDVHIAAQTVAFVYEHPLATPMILPPPQLTKRGSTIAVDDKVVLRFGMVDGEAVVHADAAVYDPQSAYEPIGFAQNGSTASRLAIVCNRREARLLTGAGSLDEAARRMAEREHASVVVVKRGTHGATVFVDGEFHHVPAFRTTSVWPIGSGDVFSAVFTKAWALENLSAVESARRASLATALYCQSRTLPVVTDLEASALEVARVREDAGQQIYLAGPFFNMMQRWMIRQAREAISDCGLRVFSPLHDVGHGLAEDVATKDIEGLEASAAVFAVCDGLDSGTLFEIGYARKLGIPVVAFVQSESEESLKMLQGTGCEIVHDFASAIYHLTWVLNG